MIKLVDCEVLCGLKKLDQRLEHAFGSDLMSDVLAYVEEETLLLTGLTNAQVIRTAEMLDLKAVLFVRGKKPSQDVIELASENDIVLLTTNHTMYVTSGILYSHGLKGLSI
jgi:predicted transcriptional regulator